MLYFGLVFLFCLAVFGLAPFSLLHYYIYIFRAPLDRRAFCVLK